MLQATAREAAQNLTTEVQTSRKRGGDTPVKFGFLINSFSAALNSVPSGPSEAPPGYSQQDWDSSPVVLVINRVKIGDRLVLGYSARYAQYMELKYKFVGRAAQNWTQHVDKAARHVARTVKG